MKIVIEDGSIFLETNEYSDFYMRPVPCRRFITLGEAVRLKKELDNAILTLQPPEFDASGCIYFKEKK